MEWTPRGRMKTEQGSLIFERHLYLRQPGYGSCYVISKYLLESAMAYAAKQVENDGEAFTLKVF